MAESGKEKGQYKRESVRGGIIAPDTAQVNLLILEYGEKRVDEIMGAKDAPKKEEAPKK